MGRLPAVPRLRKTEPSDLITIAEAATLLGVSIQTTRRRDESGKFRARRRPINGYRQYARTDAMKLRKRIIEGERAA